MRKSKGPSTHRIELVAADQIARALKRVKRASGDKWKMSLYVGYVLSDVEWDGVERTKLRQSLNLP